VGMVVFVGCGGGEQADAKSGGQGEDAEV